jgi:hypothetical protein
MLNSTVLEVGAGLIFTFLAVSLATSALVEAIASALKWRSRTLLAGVKALVNDGNFSGLAKGLYEHALVNPRGPGVSAPKTNMPAYIDSQRFAEALLDVVGLTNALRLPSAAAGANMAAAHTVVDTNVPRGANAQINNLLHGAILRGLGDFAAVKQEIASWFDTGMDRVSGAYKRWSQLVGFCIALILCVSLNIDTVHIARTLWVNPGIAATVKATQDAKSSVTELVGSFPVGWPQGFFPKGDAKVEPLVAGDKANQAVPGAANGKYAEAIIGWLITALATLFGAPFWFDALQSVIRLKGAGPSPKEKTEGKAAAA